MTLETTTAAGAAPAVHPLLERLMALLQAPSLDTGTFDAWTAAPGHALAVFTEDPVQYRETLDIAVIVPEIAAAFPGRFRTAVLLPAAARAIARRYGVRRWPALVMLRDGKYVGAIDGLRNWDDYVGEIGRLLEAEPTRPPSIGVAVNAEGPGDAGRCH